MKRYAPLIIIGAVLVIALGGAYALIRNNRNAERRPTNTATPSATAGRTASIYQPHQKGAATSSVTIEEFGDLQCPPCKILHEELKNVTAIKEGQVRFIFSHYPLPQIHPYAVAAAHATEAAALQNRFWEMQDYLYRNQEAWSRGGDVQGIFASYANTLGLDVERFLRDMNSPEVAERVRTDTRRGNAMRVTSTPTLFLNNREVSPDDMTAARLNVLIAEAMRK
ncbi:MAG: DsbA family protein [Pyrinomonadaceae bacterium MAG19_C2-C3]|nr:DsbA family protein [Pyrinomonadaceae bacterium MAG19_C2-C3]